MNITFMNTLQCAHCGKVLKRQHPAQKYHKPCAVKAKKAYDRLRKKLKK